MGLRNISNINAEQVATKKIEATICSSGEKPRIIDIGCGTGEILNSLNLSITRDLIFQTHISRRPEKCSRADQTAIFMLKNLSPPKQGAKNSTSRF